MDPLSCSEAADRFPTGIGLRLTPECLRIMIAVGQPFTDSFRAHRAKAMSLQATLGGGVGDLEKGGDDLERKE